MGNPLFLADRLHTAFVQTSHGEDGWNRKGCDLLHGRQMRQRVHSHLDRIKPRIPGLGEAGLSMNDADQIRTLEMNSLFHLTQRWDANIEIRSLRKTRARK